MAILNANRVINRPNNKLAVNGASLNNSECDLLKHKLPFMVYHQNIRSIRGKIDELLSMWCNTLMFFAYLSIIYVMKKFVYYAVDHIYWQLSIVEI
jgi:hypothetical protein